VRTLRYYDKEGLLSPSQYTEAGYRLYTDEDLLILQQILALKFLGFSLEEIRAFLRARPQHLSKVLAQQKAMMREKRAQIDTIIRTIEETEKVLRAGQDSWNSIIDVIQAMKMEQDKEWVKKYFTDEQIQAMEALRQQSYSEEAKRKMAQWGEWTEEDQKRVDEQYAFVASELKRLVAEGADPGSPDAQAVAKLYNQLISGFTQGDPDITAGLQSWWQNYQNLPQEQRPFSLPYGPAEQEFLAKAVEIASNAQ
jgi:DNA-binding transcriptional MerR regulator